MTPANARRWRAWMWIPAVAALLVAAAWAAVVVLLPPARVNELVRAQLRRSLAREARFDAVGVSLWPPVRLQVRRPQLAEPGGFARGAAFAADAVDLDLDVLALLGHRVVVRRLVLERPALHLVLFADGSTNLDGLVAPAPPGAPPAAAAPAMDLEVRELAIHDGQVVVDDVRAARRTAFALSTRTSLTAESGGRRLATAGGTRLSDLAFGPLVAGRPPVLDRSLARLELTLNHDGKFDAATKRLALGRLTLAVGRAELALSGVVDDPGPHARYDLRARGDGLDLGEVLKWAAAADAPAVKGVRGGGTLAFDLGARGAVAAGALPALAGRLTVRSGAFRYPGAPVGVEALALDARFAPDSVSVPDLSARISGQPVRARLLAWHLADPQVSFAVQGNVDLAAVAPLLAAPGTRLGGRAAVDVRGAGRAKDPGTLALAGGATLANVSVEAPGLPKPVTGVNGSVTFAPDRASVRQLTARAGQSSFTLDATVTRPLALLAPPGRVDPAGVTFDFRSPYLDLGELLPTTPGAPFLPNARGAGTVAIDRLRQGRLDVRGVTADVKLEPAALSSPDFALQGYGGAVQGSAAFDLRDTAKPAYAVKANVQNVQAAALLSAWTPAKDLLQGTLSTTLDFSGQGAQPTDLKRTLTLVGLAALSQGQLGPGPALTAISDLVRVPQLKVVKFDDLKLPFRIEHGRLITDPVNLTGPAGEWKLSGAVGFDGALDYAVSATLPPAAAAALSARSALAAGALSDDQGRLLLDLHVGGTAATPRVAWDTRAMRDRLAGRASQALADQRARLEAEAKAAAQQALAQRLAGGRDSAAAAPGAGALTADSLRRAAGGLLKDLFARPKAPAADTTKH